MAVLDHEYFLWKLYIFFLYIHTIGTHVEKLMYSNKVFVKFVLNVITTESLRNRLEIYLIWLIYMLVVSIYAIYIEIYTIVNVNETYDRHKYVKYIATWYLNWCQSRHFYFCKIIVLRRNKNTIIIY